MRNAPNEACFACGADADADAQFPEDDLPLGASGLTQTP